MPLTSPDVGLIDYACGNIKSIKNALNGIGVKNYLISDPIDLRFFNRILLPGVGSFDHALESLESRGFVSALQNWVLIKENRLLGICLGMQLLCNHSEESTCSKEGLCLIDAEVKSLSALSTHEIKVPHIGWNEISISNAECSILKDIPDKSDFYFVHSYAVYSRYKNVIVAETVYGSSFASIISNGVNIFGAQFHPEKSQVAGLNLLRNFVFYA